MNIKAFICNKKEVIEITSKDGTVKQHIFDVGQTLADLLYGDFEAAYEMLRETQPILQEIRQGKNEDRNWQNLFQIADTLPEYHIFFSVYQKYIYDLYENKDDRKQLNGGLNVKYLSSSWGDIEAEKENIKIIFSDCLNGDNDTGLSIAERYQDAVKGSRFQRPYALQYSVVTTEIMQIEDNPMFVDVLNPHEVLDIISFFKAYMLKNEVGIRACKSCGRFFALTGNSNVEYCNRLIEGSTKTCREAGSLRLYQKKKFENPAIKAYNKAYKTRNARIRYGKMTKEEFGVWSVEARKMRDMCVAGEMELIVFERWLQIH